MRNLRSILDFAPLALCAILISAPQLSAQPTGIDSSAFTVKGHAPGLLEVAVDRAQLIPGADGAVFIHQFPLPGAEPVDLELKPLPILSPDTCFVIGTPDGDVPFDFDTSQITFLSGHVVNHPDSHVFISISDQSSTGWIDLGPGATYGISSRSRNGKQLDPGNISIYRASSFAGAGIGAPFCSVPDDLDIAPFVGITRNQNAKRGLRQIELAIETDYEFFEIFNDADATATYIVQLYAAISSIFVREVNAYLHITFIRVWDQPGTFPFFGRLAAFREYWNNNMGHVQRDVAQYFSGRRNVPVGGVAWLNALCGDSAYSWCGYALGVLGDPDNAHIRNRDIMVSAHELGHNFGTHHTHFYGLDTCDTGQPPAKRGSIMSYCSQAYSGVEANSDMRFHTVARGNMYNHFKNIDCLSFDCNRNGIDDTIDINTGFSNDTNANGIPDECEDCNGNLVLDDEDIASGLSTDINLNGIPDECEPDCNSNFVPDDVDIALGTSLDVNGNAVPDECETDNNNNGLSDYLDIQEDMSLDLDRNIVLDSFQDCDNDGIPDLQAMQGANNVWIASALDGAVREFLEVTGTLVSASSALHLQSGRDVLITDDRRVLVAAFATDRIVEFDRFGNFVRDLVTTGSGGLNGPTGLTLNHNGDLLVTGWASNAVHAYDIQTGLSLGQFVTTGAGGLKAPSALTYSPGGDLFVTSGDRAVRQYDGTTGQFITIFVAAGSGGLDNPTGIAFKLDGNLLVVSNATNQVLEYDGTSGAFLRIFSNNGIAPSFNVNGLWGVRIGPNGNVFVSRNSAGMFRSHLTDARLYEFDPFTGYLLSSAYVQGDETGLTQPTGFDFMPDPGLDCNMNLLPDSCDIQAGISSDCNTNGIPDECDISQGTSQDIDHNGIPDECDCPADFNDDGAVDVLDFFAFVSAFAASDTSADVNGDGRIDVLDFFVFVTIFVAGCP